VESINGTVLYCIAALTGFKNDSVHTEQLKKKHHLELNNIICFIYIYIKFIIFNLIYEYVTIYNYLKNH